MRVAFGRLAVLPLGTLEGPSWARSLGTGSSHYLGRSWRRRDAARYEEWSEESQAPDGCVHSALYLRPQVWHVLWHRTVQFVPRVDPPEAAAPAVSMGTETAPPDLLRSMLDGLAT